jgi:hypothetical protein
MLSLVHVGLAAQFHPSLAINEEESKLLAQSVVNLLDQYDIVPDDKTTALVGLIMACAQIYGPRAVMIYMDVKGVDDKNKRA